MGHSSFTRNLAIVAIVMILLAMVGFGDWITGPDLSFALFYLIPICVAVWWLGRNLGIVAALGCAAVSLAADYSGAATYSHPFFLIWNCVLRLVFFFAAVMLLNGWKQLEERLARKVQERTAELRREIEERERGAKALKELAAQLSQAEQLERRRIAHDIHDGLSQMLTLLKLNLESAAATHQSPVAVQDSIKMIDELINQTRALTFELHPAMLDDLGLPATLEWYAEQFGQRTHSDVTVTEQGDRQKISRPLANYLFRASKELMSNAVKHGRAKEIIIGVHWEDRGIRVVIDDDGSGFEPAEAIESRRGLGLPGIQERMSSFGGVMRLESAIGQGTRVVIEAPLE